MQMRILPLLAAAALAIAAPAVAQKVSHNAVARDLRACLAAAGLPDDIPGCVGRAARACEEQVPGDPAVGRSVRCFEAEADAWDDVLDEATDARLDRLRRLDAERPVTGGDLARAEMLRASQADWRAFRLSECGQRAAEYSGDPMADYTIAACLMNMTADRAIDLMMQEEF